MFLAALRPRADGRDPLITNVTVIDGSGSPPLEEAVIVLREDRIAWVGRADDLPPAGGLPAHDGNGAWVIPGLWDVHMHALWEPFVSDGFLRLFAVNGVTGIRDMGGTLDVLDAVRPGRALDAPWNPRAIACGPWLDAIVTDPRSGIAVEGAEDAREAVASLAEAGVDFLKVYQQLSPEAFAAVLKEAEGRGLPVAGHVPLGIASEQASDLGMRGIEHMRSEIGGFFAEVGDAACDDLREVFRRNGRPHRA